jgi:hypothetical protein
VTAEVVERRELQVHPFADMIPPMSAKEYEGLRGDIAEHGQQEPIWTYQGKIIDGRHRYKACRELGIEPQFREWTGDEAGLIGFIFSQNFHRRHLDESQRGMVGARFMRLLEPLAKARMLAGKAAADPVVNLPEGQHQPQQPGGRTRDIAAVKFNVSGKTLQHAKAVLDSGMPALAEHVDQRRIKVSVAAPVARAALISPGLLVGKGMTLDDINSRASDPKWVRDKAKEINAKKNALVKEVGQEERQAYIFPLDADMEETIDAILPDPLDAATVKVGWNDAVGGRVARHIVAVSKMAERLPHFSMRHAQVLGKAWALAAEAAAAKMGRVLSDRTGAQIRALLMPPEGDGKDRE